jgi:ankyrin repeat protein
LDNKADVNLLSDVDGLAAIHVACTVKNFKFVKLLLENGADQNLRIEDTGETALHRAAQKIRNTFFLAQFHGFSSGYNKLPFFKEIHI